MAEVQFKGALQENVLTLLCFDTESAKLIRNVVKPELFASRMYQEVAVKAIAYLDLYGEAIKDHLPDEFEKELDSDDKKRSSLIKRTLENLYAASKHANAKYIITQLQAFVHEQTLKGGMLTAMDHIEAGHFDEAENALTAAMKARIDTFDAGTFFTDPKQSLSFFNKVEDSIPMGIAELDKRGIGPAPGTMLLLIAPAKKGKSWFLVHVGKAALQQRKRVCHITLEMPEHQVSQRYAQSIFSISKREAELKVPKLILTPEGQFMGVTHEEVTRPTLRSSGIRKDIERMLRERFKKDNPLVIKGFPTSSLTIPALNAYLDTLERLHKFTPEVLILDYPNLMALDGDDMRISLGNVMKGLRGVAQARNLSLVVVTQGNRQSADARTTTDTNVAEDYSMIGTADNVLTYSQTIKEKRQGVARIFVANARGDEDKFTVVVTQSYALGQFALDSCYMMSDYFDRIDPRVVDDDT